MAEYSLCDLDVQRLKQARGIMEAEAQGRTTVSWRRCREAAAYVSDVIARLEGQDAERAASDAALREEFGPRYSREFGVPVHP